MTAPADTDQLEVEWQFQPASIEAAASWLESAAIPGYAVRSGKVKDLSDTYYDTADWRLHAAGFTCRVRRRNDGAELTIKSMAAAQAGLRTRREVTQHLEGEGPYTLQTLRGPGSDIIRVVSGRRPLLPLFTLQQVRRTFSLEDATGLLGEIAVDATSILAGNEGESTDLARVEVEVDADAVDRARRFIDVFIVAAALSPATGSKFEAALIAGQLQPVSAAVPDLGDTTISSGMTAAQVGFAVMRKHFGVFLRNELSTRIGDDIEGLHDMRVAARRLRAAMQAFRPFLPPRFEVYRAELGWVARVLGEVRDLDVQIERMAEWRANSTEAEGRALDAVEALLNRRRGLARKRMLAVLDTARYDRFVARFALALQRGAPRTFVAGRAPILATAPDLLEKRYRRLRKLGDAIKKTSPPDSYHALRIEAKRLRYALEFVGPIYGKPATEFASRLTELQDLLGLHQDAEVAIDSLRDMAATNGRRLGPETVLAMGAVAERYRRHAAELRAGFPKLYRDIRGAEWRTLRKTIEARRPPTEPAPLPPTPRRVAARA